MAFLSFLSFFTYFSKLVNSRWWSRKSGFFDFFLLFWLLWLFWVFSLFLKIGKFKVMIGNEWLFWLFWLILLFMVHYHLNFKKTTSFIYFRKLHNSFFSSFKPWCCCVCWWYVMVMVAHALKCRILGCDARKITKSQWLILWKKVV